MRGGRERRGREQRGKGGAGKGGKEGEVYREGKRVTGVSDRKKAVTCNLSFARYESKEARFRKKQSCS